MTAIWMGVEDVQDSIAGKRLLLTGDPQLAEAIPQWLGLSPFAKEARMVA